MEKTTDTPIWRYMDLARYVSLLDRGLFFARADSFIDGWEGALGGADLQRFREEHARLSQADLQTRWNARLSEKNVALASTGVSCWHEADHESAALWELYIPRGLGVAVQSSVERLCASMTDGTRSIEPVSVIYSDYEKLELGTDPTRLLTHKRREFSYEREIRFVVRFRDDEVKAMNSLRSVFDDLRTRVATSWPPRPSITAFGGYASNDRTLTRRAAPDGAHLETDVKKLIDRVVLAPNVSYPTRRAVAAVTEAFGVDRHVIGESSVEMVPFDSVRFSDNVTLSNRKDR